MKDALTQKPLQVNVSGTAERNVAYVRFPAVQLDEIKDALDRHGVPYWVSEIFVSWNGEPKMGKIYFRSWVDPKKAQAALDSIS